MTTMTREEWERRFAARLMECSGIRIKLAEEIAHRAATQNLEMNGDEWLDPEEDADVEMSYADNEWQAE